MNGKYLFQQDERDHHLLPASFNAAAIGNQDQ